MAKQHTYQADLAHKRIIVTTPACRTIDLLKVNAVDGRGGWLEAGDEHIWSRANIATWLRTHRRAGALSRIA